MNKLNDHGIDHTPENIAADLIRLMHRSAPAKEFAIHLAQAEAIPDDDPRKPGVVELVQMAMAVQDRLESQQHSEQGMLAVVESAKDLSSRLNLTGLLRAIATRTRNLLGSHVTWLSVYDAEHNEFRVVVTDGAISESTTKMTAGRQLGVASVVMSTRLPFSTPDYLHDKRFPHDPEIDNTFRDEGIAALLGVPLLCDGNVLGLLFVADRYHRTYTALNIAILSTLATHAAVAINNAKAFEQANAALQKADIARAELERHARDVQSAAEAHEQLTSLLAKGASLGNLCHSIAQLLDGDVLILDEASQVICRATASDYAGTAADTYAPHTAHNAAITQALRESRLRGRSVIAYEADGEICRVTAVIGGDDVLGAVLLFRHDDLSEISIRTLERSSSVIGIVLLSQERIEAIKSRDVSTLLRALIFPRQESTKLIWERAERFGLDLSQPISMMLIEMEQPKSEFVARRLRASAPFSQLVLDEVDGVLVIVCGTTKAQDVLKGLTSTVRCEFSQDYRGVLSRPIQSSAEAPALYTTLRRALSVLARIGVQGQILDQNEMALYSVLFETHDQTSLKAFLSANIGPLIAYDEKRSADLTHTLLSYFDNNQNAKSTAARLGIHVNTLRQRLANVEELLGYWGSPSRALEIHIALRLWSVSMRSQKGQQ
ncbi:helix-turn-helix domain-containing protein [Noviherbaspirillum sp.]|jgi:DNA-binding PucR family transcriptional regulator|uniref:helix-turn-helix domain-containing protein n=1 Tax=Noviherbaspirillum sp. TaxID=1926288 RepID=UPI0025CBCE1F|nr:helix-turn-helix domain-containing protein [Noviherbaspirillum sp.]